jgi:predicted alpha/beta-hydrolase family hydrolase
MPPRKRKISDAASAPQPTKRVTRSSTKADAAPAQKPAKSNKPEDPKIESPKVESKSSKIEKAAPKPKPKSKAAANDSGPATKPSSSKSKSTPAAEIPDEATDSVSPSNYEALSITSDLVKNPVQCHTYGLSTNTPTLIFTHGAGGTLSAPAVQNFCTGFATTHPVLVFQGSMNLGSRVKGFHACIEHLESEKKKKKKLILAGRSMGARAAVMAATEVLEEDGRREVGLVLVSYPLQGPKDVRDQILLDLPESVRVLFIFGSRDNMCPLELLEDVRKKMTAKSQLVVVRSADHGMHTKPAKMEKEVGEETGRLAAKWFAGDVQDEVTYVGEEG